MAIIWVDSFALYTNMLLRFNSTTGSISMNPTIGPGGSGVVGAFDGATATRNLPSSTNNASTMFTFWSDAAPASATSTIFQFMIDSINSAGDIVLTANGGLGVSVNGTVVGQSASGLRRQYSWGHVMALCSTSWVPPANNNGVGTISTVIQLYWNGVLIVNSGGSFNTNSPSLIAGKFRWNQGGKNARWGDWVMTNALTTLSDLGVVGVVPSNNGVVTGWTPSNNNNSNWQLVNDVPPNNGTTFVSAANGNNTTDTYVFPAQTIPTGGTIFAVQENLFLETDAGNNNVAFSFIVHEGANNFATAANANNNQYTYYSHVYETDPGTSAPWGLGAVGGANSQFGQRVT